MQTKIFSRLSNSIQIRNIISNSFWNVLASIVLRGNIFLVNIIIARVIGAELFGKYTLLKSTVQVFELSLGIAFSVSMTKYISEYRYKVVNNKLSIQSIVKSNLYSSAILSLILFLVFEFSSKYFSIHVLKIESLLGLFQITIVYVLFNNLVQCLTGILKGDEKFRLIFIISIFTGITNIAVVAMLSLNYNLKGAIIALVIFSFVQFIMYLFVTYKYTNYLKGIFSKSVHIDLSVIAKFNIPAIISGLSAAPAIWYINLTLSQTKNGFHELANFNAAFQIFAIIVFLPISISDATFPILNKYLSNKDKFNKIFLANLFLIFSIASIMSLIPLLFPDYLMAMFGKEFTKGSACLRYLSIAAIFSSLLAFLGKYIATINKMWINLCFNFIWAILVSILASFFINQGAIGISKAFLISYILLFIFQSAYTIKSFSSSVSLNRP